MALEQSTDQPEPSLPVVLAITGASGAAYAGRLLQLLLERGVPLHVVFSPSGAAVVRQELGISLQPTLDSMRELIRATATFLSIDDSDEGLNLALERVDRLVAIHSYKDYFTPIASGSHLTRAMVICPCSGSTLSGVSRSASQNLVERAAEVHLKESRKLIVVPRETPLSTTQIENMYKLSQAGVVVLPAAPGWYHGVEGLVDLVDFVVARILDQLQVNNSQIQRWCG
ncbi:MAG TPA: 3-octaprenyl-4-hydroxybenzoate carboxy-lyase [Planctomycetaceae bacterium]|nr:3-octaprenyl-4-hydroxybenzoate carboxy-lyase [Planctomycetaceae bacterium]